MRNLFLSLTVAILFSVSCKKEFDAPPSKEIPVGNILTIDSLRKMYVASPVSFTQDYSVYAVVTADEKNGNLYKNIFVQDNTGAINLRLLNSGGLYQGDSIRIYLKGTVLSKYNGMLQLDSVDVDKNTIKQKTLVDIAPQVATIDEILASSALQAKLVKLENVEFKCTELGKTFADAVNQFSANRYIANCNGKEVIIRTSGYANFANVIIPQGKGSLVAVVGEFNGEKQLYVRTFGEINMSGTRCAKCPLVYKDFEDNSITSGGWTMQNVTGNINWTTNSQGSGQGGAYYAQCSNYISPTNYSCETWLISPSVNLSGVANPVLTFLNAWKYNGTPLALLVSTDYSNGSPSSGFWQPLAFSQNAGNFAWKSDTVSLSSYKMNNVHIAFKYLGSNADGSTWEIDDIAIRDN